MKSIGQLGRSEEKLKSVKDVFGLTDSVNEIVVDSNDYESVQNMVSQSKCILTTVGPYQLYGLNILKACAETGVDYVDLVRARLDASDDSRI